MVRESARRIGRGEGDVLAREQRGGNGEIPEDDKGLQA